MSENFFFLQSEKLELDKLWLFVKFINIKKFYSSSLRCKNIKFYQFWQFFVLVLSLNTAIKSGVFFPSYVDSYKNCMIKYIWALLKCRHQTRVKVRTNGIFLDRSVQIIMFLSYLIFYFIHVGKECNNVSTKFQLNIYNRTKDIYKAMKIK